MPDPDRNRGSGDIGHELDMNWKSLGDDHLTTGHNRPSPVTRAVQALGEIDERTGAIVPAMQPSATFVRDADYQLREGYVYGRDTCPTIQQAERIINDLEEGAGCLLYPSGLAAAAAVADLIPQGQRVAMPEVMYHGAMDWLKHLEARSRIGIDTYDAADPNSMARAMHPGQTVMLWVETPANPNWDVVDIEMAAIMARDNDAWLTVDSTCATPALTRPITLGADFVFHSATKYLNGHSDIVAGALIAKSADQTFDKLSWTRSRSGAVSNAFDAWLLIRGMRTLHLRVGRACENAMALARFLEAHPAIERVLYPGLESHPQHLIAKRQMEGGFGGMLSVLMKGGEEAAAQLVRSTRHFLPATSLGGVESLIEHRKAVEGPHSVVPPHLVRISVGIEDIDDLIGDLTQALAA